MVNIMLNKIKTKNITNNCELLFTVLLFFTYINYVFHEAVQRLFGNVYNLDRILVYGLFVVLFLITARELFYRIKTWQIILCLSVLFILFVSYCFSTEPSINTEVIKSIITYCFPAFLLAGAVRDFSKLKRYMVTVAIMIPYCFIFLMYVLDINLLGEDSTYSQSMAYLMLLPTVILVSNLMEKFRIRDLVPFILGVFLMFSYGARGPVACLLLFIILKLLFTNSNGNKKRKILLIIGITLISSLIYMYFNDIILWLLDLFTRLDLSTRTVQKLLENSFLEDNARNRIYDSCLSRIFEQPFWGTGLINDRIYLANAFYNAGSVGSYPHNIFLEVFIQFGLIIGSVVLGLIAFLILKSLSKKLPDDTRSIVLIFIGSGLLPLLFSGSYISSENFYILMGICGAIQFSCRLDKNQIKNTHNEKLKEKPINVIKHSGAI